MWAFAAHAMKPPCCHAAWRCVARSLSVQDSRVDNPPPPPRAPLQEFNKGLFDYLVATDDVHAAGPDGEDGRGAGRGKRKDRGSGSGQRKGQGPRKDEEFGVTRGIDFKGVHTVVNFEMPGSAQG